MNRRLFLAGIAGGILFPQSLRADKENSEDVLASYIKQRNEGLVVPVYTVAIRDNGEFTYAEEMNGRIQNKIEVLLRFENVRQNPEKNGYKISYLLKGRVLDHEFKFDSNGINSRGRLENKIHVLFSVTDPVNTRGLLPLGSYITQGNLVFSF